MGIALVLTMVGLGASSVAGASTTSTTLVASATALTTDHSSLGPVTATLTFRGTYPESHGAVLTITTSGRVDFRHGVTSSFCGHLCWPQAADYGGSPDPVQVVRLGAGAPDVVVGLYSGGAHCCTLDEIYSPLPASSTGAPRGYATTEVFFGDPGAQLRTLPGDTWPVFVTADDTFAYAFTDYAASGLPLKILRFSAGHMVDVTRHFRHLVSLDAQSWLRAFYQQASMHYADSVGVIAAWAADEYLLGRSAQAQAFLRRELKAGHLRSALNQNVTGEQFIAHLSKFLHQHGY